VGDEAVREGVDQAAGEVSADCFLEALTWRYPRL
jgi:hypothetical protein